MQPSRGAEARLAQKLEHDAFREKVDNWIKFVATADLDGDMSEPWEDCAHLAGLRLRTARVLYAQPEIRQRIRDARALAVAKAAAAPIAVPAPEVPTVRVAEVGVVADRHRERDDRAAARFEAVSPVRPMPYGEAPGPAPRQAWSLDPASVRSGFSGILTPWNSRARPAPAPPRARGAARRV